MIPALKTGLEPCQGSNLAWQGSNLTWQGSNLTCQGSNLTCQGSNLAWQGSNLTCQGSNLAWQGSNHVSLKLVSKNYLFLHANSRNCPVLSVPLHFRCTTPHTVDTSLVATLLYNLIGYYSTLLLTYLCNLKRE